MQQKMCKNEGKKCSFSMKMKCSVRLHDKSDRQKERRKRVNK